MIFGKLLAGLAGLMAMAAGGEAAAVKRQDTSNGRLVFAHFMVGIVANRGSAADYDGDMQLAKDAGIDAFALNIGGDTWQDTQLGYAYESAANNGMKVFLSFDFNYYKTADPGLVGTTIAKYASEPAQLLYGDDGRVVASSFRGDGVDVAAIRDAAGGASIMFLPNFNPQLGTDLSPADGALSWIAWPNNGANKAPRPGEDASVTPETGDEVYTAALGADQTYIAPVSPWFFTHYGPEVEYAKNWMFPSDTLWFDRWNSILASGPDLVEVVTWNDYGESHYVGPLSSPHNDDGNSKWAYGRPHSGFLDMARPYIAAYKAGATDPAEHITEDSLVYWFRPVPRDLDCDATDTTMFDADKVDNSSGNYFMGRPDGWYTAQDKVYVVSLLTAPATLTMVSGGNSVDVEAPAGASIHSVDMVPGTVHFTLARDGTNLFDEDAAVAVGDTCPCGIYNFNPYVGVLPKPEGTDELLPEGYANIMAGLHVESCGPY